MSVLNPVLEGLRPSATLVINELSAQMAREGRTIYKLGFGQSPFPVPETVVEELRRQAHRKEYMPVRGHMELREAVAQFHAKAEGIAARAEDVLIGPGSKELMFLLQLAHGGDLLLPAPSWVSYAPQAQLLGRKVHWIPTTKESGWRLQPDALEQACKAAGPGPKILVLNYPNNPTGLTYTAGQNQALAETARRHGVLVLSDEIYGELDHDGSHASIARHLPEATVITSGLSKWCGAGGWRLGTMTFPRELAALRDAVAVCASETYTTASAPVQAAAVVAFRGGPEIAAYLQRARQVLAALGNWTAHRLRQAGAEVQDPEGGFYLFPDFSAVSKAPTSEAFCRNLLAETGVALLPGADFGRPETELTARLCYVDFDGAAALSAAPIDDDFLRARCHNVLEAVDRLVTFLG